MLWTRRGRGKEELVDELGYGGSLSKGIFRVLGEGRRCSCGRRNGNGDGDDGRRRDGEEGNGDDIMTGESKSRRRVIETGHFEAFLETAPLQGLISVYGSANIFRRDVPSCGS